jgi:hypothetical protein
VLLLFLCWGLPQSSSHSESRDPVNDSAQPFKNHLRMLGSNSQFTCP